MSEEVGGGGGSCPRERNRAEKEVRAANNRQTQMSKVFFFSFLKYWFLSYFYLFLVFLWRALQE